VSQVLRPGDQVVFEETVWTVTAVGSTVRLTDGAGRSQAILLAVLLSAPGFELLGQAESDQPVRLDPVGLLDALPDSVVARAREWEGHLLEVETGLRPQAPATSRGLGSTEAGQAIACRLGDCPQWMVS
jgi:hypothetical protein